MRKTLVVDITVILLFFAGKRFSFTQSQWVDYVSVFGTHILTRFFKITKIFMFLNGINTGVPDYLTTTVRTRRQTCMSCMHVNIDKLCRQETRDSIKCLRMCRGVVLPAYYFIETKRHNHAGWHALTWSWQSREITPEARSQVPVKTFHVLTAKSRYVTWTLRQHYVVSERSCLSFS